MEAVAVGLDDEAGVGEIALHALDQRVDPRLGEPVVAVEVEEQVFEQRARGAVIVGDELR